MGDRATEELTSNTGHQSVSEPLLVGALERATHRRLRPVVAGLAILYLVLAGSHVVVLPQGYAGTMALAAAATAVTLMGAWAWLRWSSLPLNWTYPSAFAVVGLVLINSLLHQYLSEEPHQATNLILVLIAAGFFFLSWGWFASVAICAVAGWAVLILSQGPIAEHIHYGFALFEAIVVAALIHFAHVRDMRRLEGLRLIDEAQNTKLVEEVLERRQAEKALQESEDKYRNTMDAAMAGIFVVHDDILEYVNPAMARMFACTQEDLQRKKSLADLVVSDQQYVVGPAAEGREKTPREVTCLRMDGSTFFALLQLRNTQYRDQPVVVGSLMDITESRRALERARRMQGELAHMARLSVAGEMASGMAHELNQPLTAISALSDACEILLQSHKGRSDEFPEAMRQISAQSQRAGKIIRRMREFTRKTEVRTRSVDINTLVGEMAEFITADMRHQEIELRLELGGELPQVIADPVQVQQVVLNLIRNAVEAMQGSAIGHRVLRIRTSLMPEHVEVTVSDTGSGLPHEIRDRLFHPFLTTKPEGMGLGLSISHSIIEMHKGKLWATPRDGGGTNFHFTLPAAQTRA